MSPHTKVRKKFFSPWVVGFLMFLGCASLLVVVIGFAHSRENSIAKANWGLVVRPLGSDDHVIGSLEAPIQVIEYSDLQCPYCRTFEEDTIPRLQAAFGDQIVIVFRHLPLLTLHPFAETEAEASECVYEAGGNMAFWAFVHAIYAQGSEADFSLSNLPAIAGQAGVNSATFNACMKAGQGVARVKKDATEAAVAGLYETPSVIVRSSDRTVLITGNSYARTAAAISYELGTSTAYVPSSGQ